MNNVEQSLAEQMRADAQEWAKKSARLNCLGERSLDETPHQKPKLQPKPKPLISPLRYSADTYRSDRICRKCGMRERYKAGNRCVKCRRKQKLTHNRKSRQ